MNTRRGLIFVFTALALMTLITAAAVQPAHSAAVLESASRAPWTVNTFQSDLVTKNISTVFGGPAQVPITSYFGSDALYQWIRITYPDPDGSGNCGPGDRWACQIYLYTSMKEKSLSAVAEHTFINSFKLGWVYEDTIEKAIFLRYQEFSTGMVSLSSGNTMIYNPTDEWTVTGQPSLAYDSSGNAHVALVVTNTSTNARYLKYIHYTNTTQTSCGFSSRYDCINVKYTDGPSLGTQPGIVVTPDGNPRIMFYYGSTLSLMYAYPATALQHPNCGPSDNTWRCVAISSNVQSDSDMDIDMSANATRPQMAWTYTDGLNQTWVYHARYVGSGGNCGEDYRVLPTFPPSSVLGNLWDCTQTAEIGKSVDTLGFEYVSIQVDDEDNPVIAFPTDTGVYYDLGVIYGNSDGSFDYQKVDGHGIHTGKDPALALNTDGRGFIAFIEDEEYSPNLRIATQYLYTYIPLIMR